MPVNLAVLRNLAQSQKNIGDYWVDVPLIAPQGVVGKLTLDCNEELRPEAFEMLKVLGPAAAQMLVAHRRHEREVATREEGIRTGLERSMASVAHNLASRLAALPVLLARYRLRESQLPEIRDLNCDFERICDNTLLTIKRTKDLLAVVVPRPASFDLTEMCNLVLSGLLNEATEWDVFPKSPFIIEADQHFLESALVELIQNSKQAAIRTPLRITVRLEGFAATGRPPWVRLTYEDNGRGVDQAFKTRIFEDFFTYRPGQKSGAGLGLAFLRRVVQAHGGRTWEDGAPGHGARFIVELPRYAGQS